LPEVSIQIAAPQVEDVVEKNERREDLQHDTADQDERKQ
jgi:hypothetical protein